MRILPSDRGEAYWRKIAAKKMKGSTYRMRRARGMSPEEAATKPVKVITPVLANPNSMAQTSLRYGLRENAVSDWKMRNPGRQLSNDEIAKLIVQGKRKREAAIAFNKRCREKGLNPRTVRGWMKMYDMTEEQAMARKKMSRVELGRQNSQIRKNAVCHY